MHVHMHGGACMHACASIQLHAIHPFIGISGMVSQSEIQMRCPQARMELMTTTVMLTVMMMVVRRRTNDENDDEDDADVDDGGDDGDGDDAGDAYR
jgi:hypothetical protein